MENWAASTTSLTLSLRPLGVVKFQRSTKSGVSGCAVITSLAYFTAFSRSWLSVDPFQSLFSSLARNREALARKCAAAHLVSLPRSVTVAGSRSYAFLRSSITRS
ncbi:hypothetical protein D9M69_565660 [compost metagenome]